MEESILLNNVVEYENKLSLYDETILGIPIWRIVRYHARLNYISEKTGYIAGSPSVQLGKVRPKLFSGFWRVIRKKDLSVFFCFNRLVRCKDSYLDKFVDPIIAESELKNGNFVILDSSNYIGGYERINKEHAILNEGRTLTAQFLKYLFKIITPILYGKTITLLFNKVKDFFILKSTYRKVFNAEIASFLAKYYYFLFLFKIIKPRRVFLVYREGYFPQIAVCKKLGIPVAEFQHGITLDSTVSFAGKYDPRIDPDYFLVFGEYWKGPQFGMPLDRIVNIGWAYSKYLQKTVSNSSENHGNEILVISSPEISDAILDSLKVLSVVQGDYSFDIRLHPCESYNDNQKQKLQSIPKAQVVDNKTDSALVLPTYKYVVGENSSVIYEALSAGCKVGMLNLCGLRPAIDLPGIKENFFIINDAKDFKRFLTEESTKSISKAEFYSEFDNKKFMEFINQKM